MPRLFASKEVESARMFQSDFLEKLTYTHPLVPLLLYVPVVLFLLYQTALARVTTVAAGGGLFLAGVFVWSLAEYVIHRFAFHYEPCSAWGQRLHFVSHGVHHDYPRDSRRLVMPPALSIPLALLFYGLCRAGLGPHHTPPFFAGFLTGCLCYDMIPYATHHFSMKSGPAKYLKQYHMRHHYQSEDHGYGVGTPLWDMAFGTLPREPKTRVQARAGEEHALLGD